MSSVLAACNALGTTYEAFMADIDEIAMVPEGEKAVCMKLPVKSYLILLVSQLSEKGLTAKPCPGKMPMVFIKLVDNGIVHEAAYTPPTVEEFTDAINGKAAVPSPTGMKLGGLCPNRLRSTVEERYFTQLDRYGTFGDTKRGAEFSESFIAHDGGVLCPTCLYSYRVPADEIPDGVSSGLLHHTLNPLCARSSPGGSSKSGKELIDLGKIGRPQEKTVDLQRILSTATPIPDRSALAAKFRKKQVLLKAEKALRKKKTEGKEKGKPKESKKKKTLAGTLSLKSGEALMMDLKTKLLEIKQRNEYIAEAPISTEVEPELLY